MVVRQIYLAYTRGLFTAGCHCSVQLLLDAMHKAGEIACAGGGGTRAVQRRRSFEALQARAKLSLTFHKNTHSESWPQLNSTFEIIQNAVNEEQM